MAARRSDTIRTSLQIEAAAATGEGVGMAHLDHDRTTFVTKRDLEITLRTLTIRIAVMVILAGVALLTLA
ncbi:hypothetical protein [Inquilinus sp. CAU 1745]|uniref:hypothetical protein n=1 Tax=Inquilinus sp. CAU 1745 TaxID=3140369 RepID=UPI00325A49BA